MQLADLGAEVIKIEPPEGDYSRTVPPHFFHGDSAYYLSINRNKLSLVLDLKTRAGLRVLYDLAKKSDVLMSAFSPEATRRLRIDYPRLRRVNPRLIVANLIAFDHKGPWRDKPGFDSIVQAMSGVMSLTGEAGGAPARAGIHVGDQTAGLYLATAILAALIGRERTGSGQRVEVPPGLSGGLLDDAGADLPPIRRGPRRDGKSQSARPPGRGLSILGRKMADGFGDHGKILAGTLPGARAS